MKEFFGELVLAEAFRYQWKQGSSDFLVMW